MKNIFTPKDNLSLIERVQKLHSQSQPLWGKMSVEQMLLHCHNLLDMATGKLLLKRGLIGFLFGKMAKRSFLKEGDFKKNLPTDKNFIVTSSPEFIAEKERLLIEIERFRVTGPSIIDNPKHPFFGMMTLEEWGILHYKHLDHHLKQFGV